MILPRNNIFIALDKYNVKKSTETQSDDLQYVMKNGQLSDKYDDEGTFVRIRDKRVTEIN